MSLPPPTTTTPFSRHDPLERQLQLWRHRVFLRWLLPLATFFGAVEVIAAIPLDSPATAVTGAIILVYAAAVVIAYRALSAGRLESSVRITWVGIIVAAISIAIVQPFLWPPLAMIPLVAVGVALPYSRGGRLVRLLATADVAAIAIALLGMIGEPPAGAAELFESIFRVAAIGAVATLILVLLFLFSTRLNAALEASVEIGRVQQQLAEERRELDRRTLEHRQLESVATLAGGIAQQFNNLLVVILGNAAILREELTAGAGGRAGDGAVGAIAEIEAASNRASVLAHQMLAYGGRGQFVLTTGDLGAIVEEAIAATAGHLPAGVELRRDLDPATPPIHADHDQIRRLTEALLVNAIEAIGPGPGRITIRTRPTTVGEAGALDEPEGAEPSAPVAVLEVADTGVGMDDETREAVFQPFFSTKFVGRGLGLAAARGIVRSHGGRIDVASTPGRGATFTVFLPASEPASAGAQPAGDAPLLSAAGRQT